MPNLFTLRTLKACTTYASLCSRHQSGRGICHTFLIPSRAVYWLQAPALSCPDPGSARRRVVGALPAWRLWSEPGGLPARRRRLVVGPQLLRVKMTRRVDMGGRADGG